MDEGRESTLTELKLGTRTPDGQALVTYQGLHRRVAAWFTERGLRYELKRHSSFKAVPKLDRMHGFRFSQKELLTKFLLQNMSGCFEAPTRYGKCFDPATPVMMADGSSRRVDAIRVGDKVMGHDSLPRTVATTITGRDVMYRIVPNKGEPHVVTQDHVLVLQRTNCAKRGARVRKDCMDGAEVLITVRDYLKQSKTFKHIHKLVKRPVSFASQPVPVDPYCYGLWIGDGTTRDAELTTMDEECSSAWCAEASRCGLQVHEAGKPNNKALRYYMRGYTSAERKGRVHAQRRNVWRDTVRASTRAGHKRILETFLHNSKDTRLAVLAGIIDSDGYVNNGKVYVVTSKHEALAQDVQALARSLGFRATILPKARTCQTGACGVYHDVQISGAVDTIPVRLPRKKLAGIVGRANPLTTGFSVELVGEGPFAGFGVEEDDKRFLLADFTVTHNSRIIFNILRAFPGEKTVVTMPGIELLEQLYEDLKAALPGRRIAGIWSGSPDRVQCDDITVVSLDSIDKCDFEGTKLLLVDEAHTAVTESRGYKLHSFTNARRIALSATLSGRFDKADILIEGIFGPVLACRTFLEAVKEGAICMIAAVMVHVELPAKRYKSRQNAYEALVWENPQVVELIRTICRDVIPPDKQTLVFIANEKQADMLHAAIVQDDPGGVVAMAKKLNTRQRKALFGTIQAGQVRRCVASKIYSTGVTFPDIRFSVNIEGGGAYITCVQKPGRLAEIKPGKKFGILVDFMFKPAPARTQAEVRALQDSPGLEMICADSRRRLSIYMQKGYRVLHTNSDVDNLRHLIQTLL